MKTLQINGPFFTNYSYARVNRGLGLALSRIQDEFEINLYADREAIDYYPNESDLEKKPELKKLFKNNQENDVVIYNNFPKSITNLHGLKDLPGKVKLAYIAWEESIYPKVWVDEINENLDGVMTISSFTKEVLEKSGVKIPIVSVPIALDDEIRIEATEKYKFDTSKKFKFLHISTAKQRKGVDLLLKAYFEEFTKDDDVVLVLKTSPGPDNIVDSLIKEMQTENSPEIIQINDSNLSEEELRSLHASANCEVYPSRAEGFGLPILEAMFHRIPVITTGYSGQLEFCNEENAYLIDYKVELAKDSELVNIGAKWAEPDIEHLKKSMKEVYIGKTSNPALREMIEMRVRNAKETAEKFSWDNTAKKALDFIKEIEIIAELKNKNAAIITPFNDETGIAEYSKNLYKSVERSFKNLFFISNKDILDQTKKDGENVKRLWSTGEESFEETLKFIQENEVEFVHIQYHSGSFFSTEALGNLVRKLKNLAVRNTNTSEDNKVKVFLTFHAFRAKNFDYLKDVKHLNLVDRIFIHNPNDFEYASQKLSNVEYFILPALEFKKRNKRKLRKELGIPADSIIVASHGLMNTNKNIPEIITAISQLKKPFPNIHFFAVNAVSSNNIHSTGIYEKCREIVDKENLHNDITFFSDFLEEEYIEILLQVSDVIIFNYSEVGESASASIRKALASQNPVVVTDINMFSEFTGEVLKIKDASSESVRDGLNKVLIDQDLQEELIENAKKFIGENLYDKKALETLKIYIQ